MSPVYLVPLAGLIVSLAMSAPQPSDRILRSTSADHRLLIAPVPRRNRSTGLHGTPSSVQAHRPPDSFYYQK
jgi:hypothetical protein